jgi:hypothetical protein
MAAAATNRFAVPCTDAGEMIQFGPASFIAFRSGARVARRGSAF